MSKDGEKAAVFKTTKVRTKLRGDNSWLQRQSESQAETEEEKPWIAEVKARRVNGVNDESSPVSTTTQSAPSPLKTNPEQSPTSGFMIRGVFKKTETTPVTSNGYSGTTQFTKKPSETYKKIAPHIVRNTENQEDLLSQEEQEKRTEAASNVLKKTATRQRSYVLSAAKLYDSKEKTPDLLVNSTTSFVAKRVEVADDDESNTSASSSPTNVVPLPKPRTLPNTRLTQFESKEETKPEDVKVEEKVREKLPIEDMVPGCTKVDTPLPELIPSLVKAVYVKSDDSADAERPESPVVEPAPKTPATPPPKAVTVESIVIVTEDAVKAETQLEPEPNLDDTGHVEISSNSIPVRYQDTTLERFKEEEPLQLVKLEPEQDLVKIENTLVTLKQEESEQPVVEAEAQTEANDEPKPDLAVIKHIEISAEQEPSPPFSNVEPLTDDLLGFSDSAPQLIPLVPRSPGPWSQDLLSPVESEKPEPEKHSNIVDLLSNEDIVITQVHSLSTQPDVEEEKPPATEAQSVTETVTITTKTVIITDESEVESADPLSSRVITTVTESSSTDPFDPYPIGTTSSNSPSDLLQPLADISITSASSTSVETKGTDPETRTALKSLSDDIIPFNPEPTTSLSTHRSWARTWETPQPESTEESQEAAAAVEEGGHDGDQETVIMFERKSKENDSPWDRWTSPTVYTFDNEDDKEDEPAKSEETENQVITTVTTIRETYSEPEPSMDRILTEPEPEPESKKPFVYVKEYVNTSELSLLNARDADRSDYLTSRSTSYSYSSPSTYLSGSLSYKCTFCGEPVGSDAKITIEHLNINCHPECFKCGVCARPMGDLLDKMFLHGGKVHCEPCYRNALD